jgi:hypothetical protein
MARKKDIASVVVEFFETASVDTAVTVLAICKGIVARRQPATKPRRATKPAVPLLDEKVGTYAVSVSR